jgi:hypothetical protein
VELDVRLLHGLSFGAATAENAEHRPDYTQTAVRWGSSTRPARGCSILVPEPASSPPRWSHWGARVVAVESDPAMLAKLRRALPVVYTRQGSAEALPLPDASIDAVLAGNTMHGSK